MYRAAVSTITPRRVQPRYPITITSGKPVSSAIPRIESPDSIIPVFWTRITGTFPATFSPSAVPGASPSRETGTTSSHGCSTINSYR